MSALEITPALVATVGLITVVLVAIYVKLDCELRQPLWHTLGAGIIWVILILFKSIVSAYETQLVIALGVILLFLPAFYLTRLVMYVYSVSSRYRTLRQEYLAAPRSDNVAFRRLNVWHCRNEDSFDAAQVRFKQDFAKVVEDLANAEFSELVQKHFLLLSRKRSQGTFIDEYDVLRESDWRKEANYFVARVAFISIDTYGVYDKPPAHWHQMINDMVPYVSAEVVALTMSDVITGIDYESFVAGLLETAGWQATLTPATGDHGADIIANKGGFQVAIQCKLYSSPVGNSSVQEAYTAKDFYQCQAAVVVSNASYTKAARTVATRNKVHLVHHDEIVSLMDSLGHQGTAIVAN
jgi:hypothetical protein